MEVLLRKQEECEMDALRKESKTNQTTNQNPRETGRYNKV